MRGRQTVHRPTTGRSYNGMSIHAAGGVHEYAARLCQRLVPAGGRILEVGAGSGALALRLRDLGFDVVATDLEPVHDWIHRLDLDHPDLSGATSGPFDLVLCIETLEHVENPRAVLRALRSLVRAGDKVVISTPNVSHPYSRLKMLLVGAPFVFGPDHYYETGHITILPDWLLTEHLHAAGFEDVRLQRAGDFDEGKRRLVERAVSAGLRMVGLGNKVDDGDGICLFAIATAC